MEKIKIKISIEVLTGLHIGTGNDKVQIGGVDSAVMRDPITNLPYIPGSSLKGKMRCLLETEGGFANGENNPEINKIFGFNNSFIKINDKKIGNDKIEESPTRLLFRDLFLDEEYAKDFKKGLINTEFKTEIVVDRKKGTAKDGGLRTIERVPPGVKFVGDIIIRYMDVKEKEDIMVVLKNGFELLNNDFLGGSGSRGYGAVKITEEKND